MFGTWEQEGCGSGAWEGSGIASIHSRSTTHTYSRRYKVMFLSKSQNMEEVLKRQCQKVGLLRVSQMADGPIEARYEFYTI
jgi:hypothetical protein